MQSNNSVKVPLWLGLVFTLAMVIIVRELALIVCQWVGIEKAANIVGLVVMFLILVVWRWLKGLPKWITRASNMLLVESGFAFLPVSAGAGILLFALGDEFWGVMLTMLISTLIPLWALALLANRWLNSTTNNSERTDSEATHSQKQP
jgi:putative effector of murein hydrolase LrgA (UPF0299 family)